MARWASHARRHPEQRVAQTRFERPPPLGRGRISSRDPEAHSRPAHSCSDERGFTTTRVGGRALGITAGALRTSVRAGASLAGAPTLWRQLIARRRDFSARVLVLVLSGRAAHAHAGPCRAAQRRALLPLQRDACASDFEVAVCLVTAWRSQVLHSQTRPPRGLQTCARAAALALSVERAALARPRTRVRAPHFTPRLGRFGAFDVLPLWPCRRAQLAPVAQKPYAPLEPPPQTLTARDAVSAWQPDARRRRTQRPAPAH